MIHGAVKIKKQNPAGLLKQFFHFCIAQLPVLYLINFPGLNISLGTVIILGFVPYSGWIIIKKIKKKQRIKAYAFFFFFI